ncbi:hypothetical protein C8R48DRAFT_76471 [Suillus tomentosus]|nr:hypothetical protein C8R48DRAFT_76471 [Suillus tomentosus]
MSLRLLALSAEYLVLIPFIIGMLIFGCTHLYMLEGLMENSEGKVIDAGDAPEGLFLISGSAVDVRNLQRAQ